MNSTKLKWISTVIQELLESGTPITRANISRALEAKGQICGLGDINEVLRVLVREDKLERRSHNRSSSSIFYVIRDPPNEPVAEPIVHTVDDLHEKVLEFFRRKPSSGSALRRTLGLDNVGTQSLLKKLVKAGLLQRKGKCRGTIYTVPKSTETTISAPEPTNPPQGLPERNFYIVRTEGLRVEVIPIRAALRRGLWEGEWILEKPILSEEKDVWMVTKTSSGYTCTPFLEPFTTSHSETVSVISRAIQPRRG